VPVDVLAVGAHPDDIELTCAGTLVMLARRGRRFGMLDLTRSEMGTRGSAATREAEARLAAEILGAAFRETLDLTDGGLQTGRAAELAVIEVIRREKPRLVLTSYPEDRHPDHARAGRLVTDAAFYAGLRKLETAHPAHRPQQVLYYSTFLLQEPSLLVDITAAMETRRAAVRAFASQFHDPTSTEPQTMLSKESFLEKVEARAHHFGMLAGVEFADGFVSRRPPKIDDLVGAFEGFEAGF
jgi:bacillithiol biosynthesis deacetylase BshB1